jgi:hypothetical protein
MSHHSQGRDRSAGIVYQQLAVAQTIVADRLREADDNRLRPEVETSLEPERRGARRLLARLLGRKRTSSGKFAAEQS